jgi:hypothetical protein
LSDGSSSGEWRLPNNNELQSLLNPGLPGPYLSTGMFTDVQRHYWSSTSVSVSLAWFVNLDTGEAFWAMKPDYSWVWPVRDYRSYEGP